MSIHLLLGPMFAGKSTELIRRSNRFKIANKKVFIIKYSDDIRHGSNNNNLSTHDENFIKCDYATKDKLMDDKTLNNKLRDVDVICIDEGQFYYDIDVFAEYYANKNKIVIISALSGDFQRKPFDKITKLIPLAEEVNFLTAVCLCGKDAPFTKRTTKEIENIVIGGNDKYVAQCRECYLKQ